MKKYLVLGLTSLVISVFAGCGSDMSDTEKKDKAYYQNSANYKETKAKAEWCLETMKAPITDFKLAVEYYSNFNGENMEFDRFITQVKRGKIDLKKFFDDVNAYNCLQIVNMLDDRETRKLLELK